MKLCYNEATAMGCSTVMEDLELCQAVGFEEIELRIDMLGEHEKVGAIDDVTTFFKRSSIKPSYLCALYLFDGFEKNLMGEREREFIEMAEHAAEIAVRVGAPGFVVVPPFTDDASPYNRTGETVKNVAKMLRRLAGITGSLKLALEPVGAKKCALPTMFSCKEAIKLSGLDNVGLTVDICNIFMHNDGEGVLDELNGLDAFDIYVAHICDFDGTPYSAQTREDRCFCGEGTLPVKDYVEALKKTGYDGALSIETFRPGYYKMHNSILIKKAYDTTKPFVC